MVNAMLKVAMQAGVQEYYFLADVWLGIKITETPYIILNYSDLQNEKEQN